MSFYLVELYKVKSMLFLWIIKMKYLLMILLLSFCFLLACSEQQNENNTQLLQVESKKEKQEKIEAIKLMLEEIDFVTSKDAEWELSGINTENDSLDSCTDNEPCQIHIRDKKNKYDDLYIKVVIQQFSKSDGSKYWKAYKLNFLLDDSN